MEASPEIKVNLDSRLGEYVENFDINFSTLEETIAVVRADNIEPRDVVINLHAPVQVQRISKLRVFGKAYDKAKSAMKNFPAGHIHIFVGSIVDEALDEQSGVSHEVLSLLVDEVLRHELAHRFSPDGFQQLSSLEKIRALKKERKAARGNSGYKKLQLEEKKLKNEERKILRAKRLGSIALSVGTIGLAEGVQSLLKGSVETSTRGIMVDGIIGLWLYLHCQGNISRGFTRDRRTIWKQMNFAQYYYMPSEIMAREKAERFASVGKICSIELKKGVKREDLTAVHRLY